LLPVPDCWSSAYFARALLEPPFDPLRGIYSRSVLASYASACAIVGRVRGIYEREPLALLRYAFFWTNTFSAAVILCSIAIRAPDCALAGTALSEFGIFFPPNLLLDLMDYRRYLGYVQERTLEGPGKWIGELYLVSRGAINSDIVSLLFSALGNRPKYR
jgi:hypothetical protein